MAVPRRENARLSRSPSLRNVETDSLDHKPGIHSYSESEGCEGASRRVARLVRARVHHVKSRVGSSLRGGFGRGRVIVVLLVANITVGLPQSRRLLSTAP